MKEVSILYRIVNQIILNDFFNNNSSYDFEFKKTVRINAIQLALHKQFEFQLEFLFFFGKKSDSFANVLLISIVETSEFF